MQPAHEVDVHVLTLPGCRAEPLLAYLKALGVLRLVSGQADPSATARWVADNLQLTTRLAQEALIRFFVDQYRPTPMLAPWNAGSGFWDEQANGQALRRLRESTNSRLQAFRDAVAQVDRLLEAANLAGRAPAETKKLLKEKKVELLRLLRSRLSEEALSWIDATTVLYSEQAKFAPVLGTGGNDGRLEFTPNLIQRLEQVMPFEGVDARAGQADERKRRSRRGFDRDQSEAWIRAALFADGAPSLVDAAVGQYHPGGIGGPNSAQGFEAGSLVNPWDYVLMMEGVLLLGGAAARRMGSQGAGHSARHAAFPFTVSPTAAGVGTYSQDDGERARAEVWLPLWQGDATLREVQQLFAEGRAQRGRTQAKSGLDFALAVSTLGVDRGISAFQRFAIVQRNGLAFLATPLGRIAVRDRSDAHLLDEPDVRRWMDALKRESSGHASMAVPVAALERAIFQFCERGRREDLAGVAAALGRVERALSRLPKLRDEVSPLSLSGRWLSACDDDSPEYRLAVSLGGLRWKDAGALRTYLEPAVETNSGWAWERSTARAVWGGGGVARNLLAVAQRRLVEARRSNFGANGDVAAGRGVGRQHTGGVPVRARPRDVSAFIAGRTDDSRLEDLIWAMACVSSHDRSEWEVVDARLRERETAQFNSAAADEADAAVRPDMATWLAGSLPRSYLVLKLLFLEMPFRWADQRPSEGITVASDSAVLNLVGAGRLDSALEIAARRLWASGLVPLGYLNGRGDFGKDHASPGSDPMRIAAALIFPIARVPLLAELVLRRPVRTA